MWRLRLARLIEDGVFTKSPSSSKRLGTEGVSKVGLALPSMVVCTE